MYYILNNHETVPCGNNVVKWAKWFEKADRHVADDTKSGIRVSTIFLGLDHSFGGGLPILFETMVFGGKYDNEMKRYHTWEEAEQGHKAMCEIVFKWRNRIGTILMQPLGRSLRYIKYIIAVYCHGSSARKRRR